MVIDTGINYNLTAGTSVGLQPTYQWNAKVTSGTIQIYDAEGNAVADSYTSEGDHITILSICPSEYTQLSLALIQFSDQSNSCYIQGYIKTSDFNLLECRFNNSWIDTTNNQQIIFANGDLADRTLSTGDYQTYLYATDNYACISFLNDDNAFKSGFVSLGDGSFGLGTSSKKANNSLPSGINMNLQTGFSTLNASINIINSFSAILMEPNKSLVILNFQME